MLVAGLTRLSVVVIQLGVVDAVQLPSDGRVPFKKVVFNAVVVPSVQPVLVSTARSFLIGTTVNHSPVVIAQEGVDLPFL